MTHIVIKDARARAVPGSFKQHKSINIEGFRVVVLSYQQPSYDLTLGTLDHVWEVFFQYKSPHPAGALASVAYKAVNEPRSQAIKTISRVAQHYRRNGVPNYRTGERQPVV